MKRLAASVAVAGRSSGFDEKQCARAAPSSAQGYRTAVDRRRQRSTRWTCGTSGSSSTSSGRQAAGQRQELDEADRQGQERGRPQEPPRRAGQADRGRRRSPTDPRAPATDPTLPGRPARVRAAPAPGVLRAVPRVGHRRPSPPAAALPRHRPRRSRWSAWAASARGASSPCSSRATTSRCSCRSSRRDRRCSSSSKPSVCPDSTVGVSSRASSWCRARSTCSSAGATTRAVRHHRLLRPPALGRQGLGDRRGDGSQGAGALCPPVRRGARPGPRPLWGRHRHQRLPGRRRLVRSRHHDVRRASTPAATSTTTRSSWTPSPPASSRSSEDL